MRERSSRIQIFTEKFGQRLFAAAGRLDEVPYATRLSLEQHINPKKFQMSEKSDALEWIYTILATFTEAVRASKLSTGLEILAALSDSQRIDLVHVCLMLLDRGTADEIPGAPDRLSNFGGIRIPPASELDVRGYSYPARLVLVATWNDEVDKFVVDLAQRRGMKHAAGVVVLGAACMLITWQLETGETLQTVFDCLPSIWGATGSMPLNTTPLFASQEEQDPEDIAMALAQEWP